jgi:hypothetical protein
MSELNDQQRQDFTTHVQTARDAATEGFRQMAVLWEARLNMAMTIGDTKAVSDILSEARMESYMDNCSCGGGGGGSFFG